MAVEATFTVPYDVVGQSLVRPGPTVWNTIPAMPATAFYLWDASRILVPHATSIAGAITFAITHPNLVELAFPNVTTVSANITSTTQANLAVFSLPNVTALNANVVITGAALTVDAINALLVQLAVANPTARVITLTGGTSAAPTGAGITAKTFLNIANTVTTN